MAIMIFLISAMLQTAPLPPATWKERNQPDMPVLQPCQISEGSKVVHSIKQLPNDVSAELARFFNDAVPMSDASGPFNSTDVISGPIPQRRFVRAYQSGRYWIIWYEQGGSVGGLRTIALHRNARRDGSSPLFQAVPGSLFAGEPCMATKAILAGVRSTLR